MKRLREEPTLNAFGQPILKPVQRTIFVLPPPPAAPVNNSISAAPPVTATGTRTQTGRDTPPSGPETASAASLAETLPTVHPETLTVQDGNSSSTQQPAENIVPRGSAVTAPKWPTYADWCQFAYEGKFFKATNDDGTKNDIPVRFPGGIFRDHQGNRCPDSNLWTTFDDPLNKVHNSKKRSYVAAATAWVVYDRNLPAARRQIPYFIEAVKVT